jgi:hypothetical protein
MKRSRWLAAPGLWILMAACSGGTPPPAEAPPIPSAAPAPPPAPMVEAADAAPPDAAAEKPKPTPAAGRPMAVLEGMTEPQTIASSGAIMRLENGAELRVPVDALLDPRNVLIAVDKKMRGSAGKIGDVYDITVQIPGMQYKIGEEAASAPIKTQGSPFVIKLPLGKATSANLAIETVTMAKKKTGKETPKSTWSVVPMTKLEESDQGNKAVFEIEELPDGHVHLTSAKPTPKEEPAQDKPAK